MRPGYPRRTSYLPLKLFIDIIKKNKMLQFLNTMDILTDVDYEKEN